MKRRPYPFKWERKFIYKKKFSRKKLVHIAFCELKFDNFSLYACRSLFFFGRTIKAFIEPLYSKLLRSFQFSFSLRLLIPNQLVSSHVCVLSSFWNLSLVFLAPGLSHSLPLSSLLASPPLQSVYDHPQRRRRTSACISIGREVQGMEYAGITGYAIALSKRGGSVPASRLTFAYVLFESYSIFIRRQRL